MARCSNHLVWILNFVTFLLSIPILARGIWLSMNASTACEHFLDKPLIVLGVFLMVVSIAGLIGSWCRVAGLFWFYLVVMFLLILVVFSITVFAFVVTNKGGGETVSGRRYKEYKLGVYSNWLENRVKNTKNWSKIRSCLVDSKTCSKLEAKLNHVPVNRFYNQTLTPLQSGCCKPLEQCRFTYVSATNWTKTAGARVNVDCQTWDNAPNKLCFDCQSCKAGLLENVRIGWKATAVSNIVFLIIVYSVSCCALRNNKMEELYGSKP